MAKSNDKVIPAPCEDIKEKVYFWRPLQLGKWTEKVNKGSRAGRTQGMRKKKEREKTKTATS